MVIQTATHTLQPLAQFLFTSCAFIRLTLAMNITISFRLNYGRRTFSLSLPSNLCTNIVVYTNQFAMQIRVQLLCLRTEEQCKTM